MANVLGVVWTVIALIVTQTGLAVWAALMLPNVVRRARRRLEVQPYRCFFLGAAFWSLSLAALSAMLQGPAPVQILGWTIAGPALACSVLGGGALASILGQRIRQNAERLSPAASLACAAFCTSVAGMMPVIGWFVFLPITGFMAVGAGLMALASKKEVEPRRSPAPAPSAGSFILSPAAEQQP